MRIENLFIYPIKSCGSIKLRAADLCFTGLGWDRLFVIVDQQGTFLSQRNYPELCLVKTDIDHNPTADSGTLAIWFEAPGMPRHYIPLSYGETVDLPCFKKRRVIIHKESCKGIDMGDEYADWFSKFLGEQVRLVRQVKRLPRIRRPSAFGSHKIRVSFVDRYPLLVTTIESLQDLNQRIEASGGKAVKMDCFRPNIVLSGGLPYDEDGWARLSIGAAELEGGTLCERCSVTTVNKRTGKRGSEPLKTLARYRKFKESVVFGRNFIVKKPAPILAKSWVTVH